MTHSVSLTAPQFSNSPGPALELANAAAPLGFTGIFVFDHLVPLGDARRPVLEGAATLGAIAATSRARVGSLVTRASLRDPSITSAIGAALAAIAPGRSVLGLGAGDSMSDNESLRYGFDRPGLTERIGLLEKTIELTRSAAPLLPIWVGGRHPRVRRVAATWADGWNAWGASAEQLTREADELLAEAGRPIAVTWGGGVIFAAHQKALDEAVAARGGVEAVAAAGLVAGTPGRVIDHLGQLATVADELVISILPNVSENWELFSREVLPSL